MDIYFDPYFGKLNEGIEKGICDTFELKHESGIVRHMFIKRELPFLIDGVQYYDLITPYGYGGPHLISDRERFDESICDVFEKKFSEYCKDQRIISEFIRFHPVEGNAATFRSVYQPVYMRKTLGTRLSECEDPVTQEFSKGCRKSIRQALNRGISYRVTYKPDNLDSFPEIYTSTMKRNGASQFYYFDNNYFFELQKHFQDRLLYIEAMYEEKPIAAAVLLLSGDIMYIHLSGTLSEYISLSPAYILRYAAVLWGKEHGYRLLFHGGGTSNAEDNPLYLYKRQFAQNLDFDFYVAKKVWNKEIYDAAVALSGAAQSDFFPLYRSCCR